MKRSLVYVTLLGACSSLTQVGKAPEFSPLGETYEQHSLYAQPMPDDIDQTSPTSASSIWSANESSLFGDRRAATRGDILTVVVEIDESAEISNTSGRNRTGSQNMAIPSLFGIPERIEAGTNGAVNLDPGISTNSSSTFKGTGSVSRNEKLTLRVAATVVEVLPNGVYASKDNRKFGSILSCANSLSRAMCAQATFHGKMRLPMTKLQGRKSLMAATGRFPTFSNRDMARKSLTKSCRSDHK